MESNNKVSILLIGIAVIILAMAFLLHQFTGTDAQNKMIKAEQVLEQTKQRIAVSEKRLENIQTHDMGPGAKTYTYKPEEYKLANFIQLRDDGTMRIVLEGRDIEATAKTFTIESTNWTMRIEKK